VLLVRKGFASIVDDPAAHDLPQEADESVWAAARTADAEAQKLAAEARAQDEARGAGRAMSAEAVKKRAEREARRAVERATADDTTSLLGTFRPESDDQSPRPDTLATAAPGAHNSTYTVATPASSSKLTWYAPERATYHTLDEAREARCWIYPTTPAEQTRCDVFADLWERGYYMGVGIKFGGDWLVYPGDPLRYHSHFVAQPLSEEDQLRPMEIVAHGRLGTATKKVHLLCNPSPEQDVEYWSVEWAGFG